MRNWRPIAPELSHGAMWECVPTAISLGYRALTLIVMPCSLNAKAFPASKHGYVYAVNAACPGAGDMSMLIEARTIGRDVLEKGSACDGDGIVLVVSNERPPISSDKNVGTGRGRLSVKLEPNVEKKKRSHTRVLVVVF